MRRVGLERVSKICFCVLVLLVIGVTFFYFYRSVLSGLNVVGLFSTILILVADFLTVLASYRILRWVFEALFN